MDVHSGLPSADCSTELAGQNVNNIESCDSKNYFQFVGFSENAFLVGSISIVRAELKRRECNAMGHAFVCIRRPFEF